MRWLIPRRPGTLSHTLIVLRGSMLPIDAPQTIAAANRATGKWKRRTKTQTERCRASTKVAS